MAKSTIVRITHNMNDVGQWRLGFAPHESREEAVRLSEAFLGIAAGIFPSTFDVAVAGTALAKASGTVTISSGTGSVTITINGVAVTRTWATSDTATAAAFVTDINGHANALVSKAVVASSAAGVVTLTAVQSGISGNWITLAASGTGMTASGARLTSGAGDDVASTTYDRS